MSVQRLSIVIAASVVLSTMPAQAQNSAAPAGDKGADQKDKNEDSGFVILTKLEPAEREIFEKTYLPPLLKQIFKSWLPFIPAEGRPPQSRSGNVDIAFYISSQGKLTKMLLGSSSGWEGLNRAAWSAITTFQPFPPFPAGVTVSELGLRVRFLVNPNHDQPVQK